MEKKGGGRGSARFDAKRETGGTHVGGGIQMRETQQGVRDEEVFVVDGREPKV